MLSCDLIARNLFNQLLCPEDFEVQKISQTRSIEKKGIGNVANSHISHSNHTDGLPNTKTDPGCDATI